MHYYRLRRTGTTDPRPRKVPVTKPESKRRVREECAVDGCDLIDDGPHGLCKKHYTRALRHGDPAVVIRPSDRKLPRGTEHPQWIGDHVGYSGAHMRVRSQRGPASAQVCTCGAPARQWSYDHLDPAELLAPEGPYSADPKHYIALCVSCHKKADLAYLEGKNDE